MKSDWLLVVIAVVMKTRSPHTTGLECPRPGIGVFQARFTDFSASHDVGGAPWATPDAFLPRNEGQFCPAAASARIRKMQIERALILIVVTVRNL
jgi:hypothetical protein